MLTSQRLIEILRTTPTDITFTDAIQTIDNEFHFTPTAFTNGMQENAADTNNGSCKLLAFAKLKDLNASETLHLFGDYYRIDVLENPTSEDHQNIRQFMLYGWNKVQFSGQPLISKT